MAGKPVVLVTEPLEKHALEYLAAETDLRQCEAQAVAEHIAEAEGLVVRTYTLVTPALLERAGRLKVVGRAGVALDNIDVPACRARGVEVVHTPAANTRAVVDYTISMILAMNRRYWPLEGYVAPAEFHALRQQSFGRFLEGLTLGIVGLGRIGSRVGRAAVGLGMRVLFNDIKSIQPDYPAQAVDKATLYRQADIVTIHVPLTDRTRGMIDADALAQFKGGAQFINAARGECVDYAALADALKSGRLASAVIDCHHPEPPPADYPLWGLDNVILTPHVAARVPQAVQAMSDVVYDVVRVCRGQAPEYPAEEGSY